MVIDGEPVAAVASECLTRTRRTSRAGSGGRSATRRAIWCTRCGRPGPI